MLDLEDVCIAMKAASTREDAREHTVKKFSSSG